MLFNRYVQGNNKCIKDYVQKFMYMSTLAKLCISQFSKDFTESYDKDIDEEYLLQFDIPYPLAYCMTFTMINPLCRQE